MGINVEITNVDKDGSSVTFTQDGQSRTLPIILPAQVKWARNGKAEVGINQEGKVNFIKSLEPKPVSNSSWGKPTPMKRAISTAEILEGVNLKEFKIVYDNINHMNDKKCGASTLFQRTDGKYDAVLYVTTFVPIGSALDNSTPVNENTSTQ